MSDILTVTDRQETGTLRMRRLRKTGKIPAVLYGHGEENILLSVLGSDLQKAINHGSHIVTLAGAVNESALLKDIQWDAFGSSILHVDLTRIDADEEVEVTLPIELKGDAPGTHAGGVVKFQRHELTLACPADKLPDKLVIDINALQMDELITAGDVELPEGARLITAPEEPIVGCSAPTAEHEPEETEEGDAAAEPEVIGAKKEDEEGGDA